MIVTVKNEVDRARGQAARSPEQGLAGALQWQYKRQDKNRFFRAGNLGYTNMLSPLSSTHRSFRLQIRSPHGNANGYASMETCLLFALYLLRASDRPGNFGTRPRSSHERAAELETFVAFLFSYCQAVHQVKKNNIQYCNPKKQYHCSHPSRVKSLQYIRRPPSYKPHQLLSSFSACPGKRSFPFPFSLFASDPHLRQVANKLHGYIYSALATYFYAGIYLHADINGHLLRRYNHDHLEQILNTSNVEILHHLVLATNHFCVMYKNNINRPST